MDIRQLRYFYVIAQERQITRAAKRLHIAQPPLSQQLKQLEAELEVSLVERNGRTLELTEAGRVLYQRAEKILHEMDDLVTEVKETGEGIRGTLSLGSVKSCFSYLPPRLKTFRDEHPKLRYKLQEGDTSFLSDSLRNREIELAIVRLPVDSEDFSILHLPPEPYVLVVPESWSHFAPGVESVSMGALEELPLLLLHRLSGIGQYEIILEECRHHGFEADVICECPDVTMLLSLVSSGVGATIVPEASLKDRYDPGIRVIGIHDATIQAEPAIVWMKDRFLSVAARKFIEQFEPVKNLQ
ncbi:MULTISPECIES: LysR family transcriptional regulator [Pontibacillus]|uniref:LysR family transcriptional regulator n=1 Tax=Pontibacillus chungwhensis TaxID=265426 RepID=A0ABY8V0X6_9BACI|nr:MULTISPECIES: LysR family transcriptional regulator [Pontibacillus]MCD5322145.1 LysR family transcriptional regulator [Pontibacillus sp. HN14]WIF99442.1 LysR family transcriptional regulator [Pontibacillus chungwhensis]